MGLNLKKLSSGIRDIFDANTAADQQRRAQAAQRSVPQEVQQKLATAKYGVLANNPQRQQQFVSSIAPTPFNSIKAVPGALSNTLTNPTAWQQAPKVNIGSFKGSGVAEDFINSPFKIGEGATNIGQGNYKRGVGQVVTGALEGPAGLIPVGKAAQVVSRSAGLLPRVAAGARYGAKQGAVFGGAYGGASAAEQDAGLADIAKSAALGTAVGGVSGAALGAAIPVAAAGSKATVNGVKNASTAIADNAVPLNQVGAINPGKQPKPNVVKYNEPQVPKSVVKLAESTPTTPKDVSKINRAWQTVNGVISQYGEQGKAIADKIAAHRNSSEIGQQKFWSSIPTVQKLSKDEFLVFERALEELSQGKVPKTSPNVRQAIQEWNAAIPTVRDAALKAGIDVGDLGPNYFPRVYKDINNSKGYNRLIDNIIATDKAKGVNTTRAEAIRRAEFIKSEGARTFGNLDKSREADVPGYDVTHDAIVNYINRAYDRISKAEQFGADNSVLDELKAQLMEQGYRVDPDSVLSKYIDIALGNTDKTTGAHKASSVVRKFNAVTSLSAAGISNMTQSTNTATVGGVGRTIKAIAQNAGGSRFGSEARQKAVDAGVLLDHSIADITNQQLGTNGKIARNIASPFFQKIEKFNRQVSAMVGADYGNHLASKAASGDERALKELTEKFGIKGPIGDKLTPAQEVQMSRKMVELSQFKVDPMDLPGWADSPLGKLAIQFRSFGYKQTGFVWNQVLREAVKGNFLPLARFVAVGAPAGLASTEIRNKVQMKDFAQPDKEEDTSPKGQQIAGRAATGLSAVGGFGLPGTAYTAASRATKSRTPTAIAASTIGGPTVGLAVETGQNLDSGVDKGDWQPLVRQAVRKIPAAGPTLANVTMPYDASKAPAKAGATPKANATPAELDKQAKADLEKLKTNAKAEGYSIEQLVNGKYAYTIKGEVKTADTLKKANQAIAKDAFGDSDQNVKVIGDTVYRKNAAGDVTTMTKTKYDYSIGTQELEKYKRADDLKGWTAAANKQLDSIEKQLQDPNIDPLDAISLQNDYEALLEKMQKYGGQGGFKKGSGGGSAMANPYKYAVNTSSGGGKPAIVRAKGAAKVGIAKQAATSTGKPKVSLKKSLV